MLKLLVLLLLLCVGVYDACLPGSCGLASDNRVAPSSNIASGAVCNGWNTPVEDLISLGLLQDVLRRLNALQASDRTVYVTGHSRGGALVGQVLAAAATAA